MSLSFPKDWPRRWWLRPGETAAYISVPGRPTTELVFSDDDGAIWDFTFAGKNLIWDHSADASVLGFEDDARVTIEFAAIARKLTGQRRLWALTKPEQAIVDVLATTIRETGQDWISGKRLRQTLFKQHGLDVDAANRQVERLGRRYLRSETRDSGDFYQPTLPGLLTSSDATLTKGVVLSVLTVLGVEFEKNPDLEFFSIDEVMRVNELREADRAFAMAVVPLLGLSAGSGVRDGGADKCVWRVPADIERLAKCRDLADFFRNTVRAAEIERPWPTAPLRLNETINETERRVRLHVPSRPPTRGATQGIASHPMQVGIANIESTYIDEKTGKMMARVAPSNESSRKAGGGIITRLFRGAVEQAETSEDRGRAEEALRVIAASSNQPDAVRMTAVAKYDVALSFAGQDRALAEELHARVAAAGYRVFYDRAEQATLWGVDLVEHLHDIYCNSTRFVLMLVSEHYAAKLWTTHERRAAQERAFKEPKRAYILPVRIDATEVPGLPSTVGYVSASEGVDEIVRLLIERLGPPQP